MTALHAYHDLALARVLPLVRDRFADVAHGGFHEQLHPDGTPVPLGVKRVMVQSRQLYVLSHAALLGERSGADAAEAGYDFMRRSFADPVHGGWWFRAGADGTAGTAPSDRRKDFYAHAFILFALAWLHRAFAAPDAIELAEATYGLMQEKLAAPGGGFWDAASEDWQHDRDVRRQNPHMHLLEALHALYEATGQRVWLAEAEAIVTLFREHFYEPGTATLGEFYHADWSPHATTGHLVEAGHHFEWVWLLHRHAALTQRPTEAAAQALFATALRHGFDAMHGGIPDQMDRSGVPTEHTRRIWPVTEAIKAHVARIEAGLPVPAGEPARLIAHLLGEFVHPAQVGWIERLSREGAPIQTVLPGSTPYHIFLSAAETSRVLGAGQASPSR